MQLHLDSFFYAGRQDKQIGLSGPTFEGLFLVVLRVLPCYETLRPVLYYVQ